MREERCPTHLVGIQLCEQVYRSLEEVHHLLLWSVVDVAFWLQSTIAGSVLVPLVFPEPFILSMIIFPVGLHVLEKTRTSILKKDLRNVRVLAGRIAVG